MKIVIIALIDVGWGNRLTLRGNWPGGNDWQAPLPMRCISAGRWEGIVESGGTFECKVLLNDATWQTGENNHIIDTRSYHIYPRFVVSDRQGNNSTSESMGLLTMGSLGLI